MAVPKRKTSQAKTSGRKAANMKKSMTGLSICPQCHEPKLPHRVCPTCGYYDGKDVVNAEQWKEIIKKIRQSPCEGAFVLLRKRLQEQHIVV